MQLVANPRRSNRWKLLRHNTRPMALIHKKQWLQTNGVQLTSPPLPDSAELFTLFPWQTQSEICVSGGAKLHRTFS